MELSTVKWIPWLPAFSAVICCLLCIRPAWRRYAAAVTVAAILASFIIAMLAAPRAGDPEIRGDYETGAYGQEIAAVGETVTAFRWIHFRDYRAFETEEAAAAYTAENPDLRDRPELDPETGAWRVLETTFQADFAYFIDPLTVLMLFVVCGIGSLVAIYGAGYMSGERGYARFFAAVSLFIFAMTTVVMADNLVLLYLGWEMVGLASYLLIGYYYHRPSAVAAAKKAFIVNRIGDLGFALGIFLTFMRYETVVIAEILQMATSAEHVADWRDYAIPFLLLMGAIGKSAQIPLYMWLPDAMEGPTPVSALIHAATMVTSGVYMIARLTPLFELSPYALPTVATLGGITAAFAATIATCQYDIKRIYAFSTVSQLGYMFMGVGMGLRYAVFGGLFHLLTHAFFKALLFLTSGNVMHGLHGQLDIRKMSGLRKVMPYTCWLMFAGCLSLAAFPFTAAFFSKDAILAGVFERALGYHGQEPSNWFFFLGSLALATAFLTAYYCFRAWFRVFMGPTEYEMGQEDHNGGDDAPASAAAHAESHDDGHGHGKDHGRGEAHEAGWLMLAPLFILAAGALFAGMVGYGIVKQLIWSSTATMTMPAIVDDTSALHLTLMVLSGAIAIGGICTAGWFHWLHRDAAARVGERAAPLVRLLYNKYYIDDLCERYLVRPLHAAGEVLYLIDRVIIDGLVAFFGFIPRLLGWSARPSQHGVLQGYGVAMLAALALIVTVVMLAVYAT